MEYAQDFQMNELLILKYTKFFDSKYHFKKLSLLNLLWYHLPI
jgi:hypothetical protein